MLWNGVWKTNLISIAAIVTVMEYGWEIVRVKSGWVNYNGINGWVEANGYDVQRV